jgi:hypothetical protein
MDSFFEKLKKGMGVELSPADDHKPAEEISETRQPEKEQMEEQEESPVAEMAAAKTTSQFVEYKKTAKTKAWLKRKRNGLRPRENWRWMFSRRQMNL